MVAFSKLISKIEEKALKLPNHLCGKRPAVADGQPRPIVSNMPLFGEVQWSDSHSIQGLTY